MKRFRLRSRKRTIPTSGFAWSLAPRVRVVADPIGRKLWARAMKWHSSSNHIAIGYSTWLRRLNSCHKTPDPGSRNDTCDYSVLIYAGFRYTSLDTQRGTNLRPAGIPQRYKPYRCTKRNITDTGHEVNEALIKLTRRVDTIQRVIMGISIKVEVTFDFLVLAHSAR